jgi:hypothetical protein
MEGCYNSVSEAGVGEGVCVGVGELGVSKPMTLI